MGSSIEYEDFKVLLETSRDAKLITDINMYVFNGKKIDIYGDIAMFPEDVKLEMRILKGIYNMKRSKVLGDLG